MKLHQTCPCGSEVQVDYAPGNPNLREAERQTERNEARKLIEQWRTAHRPCLKRLAESPAPAEFAPGPELDAHDDETERKLIVRIQNEGLLRPGLTVTDVRTALDA